MTLATVDADGLPDARMVLCKGVDERGLVFYTNIESAKGRELEGQPRAAALFHWKSLRRQARFRGLVTQVSAAESDAYFSLPAERQPDRRLGEPAVAPARRARRSRSGGRSLRAAVRNGRRSAAGLLARLSDRAGRDRVLARPALPPARARPVHPHRGQLGLEQAAPLSLKSGRSDALGQTFMAAEIAETGAVVRRQLAANAALSAKLAADLRALQASLRRDGRARQLRPCGALSQAPRRA